ncbi:hypothetical protein EB796_016635 [Bugula neritina]|uniref:Uncharacterized protein n=1 Tax=Bugula neritina TaxID=10212 RepID=A0A7J7JI57_BUGNE|nr:hypothetical protein EB796_016635 [Bugula neritina]
MFKSKANFGNSRVLQYHSSSIEEVQPHLASPRSKPNDIVLLYQDLSELVFTSLSSLVSSFKMPKGDSRLKRRALHEDSQTSLNGRPSSNLDTTNSIMHMQEKNERSGLVMWWRPIFTLWYFILECKTLLFINTVKLWHNKEKC